MKKAILRVGGCTAVLAAATMCTPSKKDTDETAQAEPQLQETTAKAEQPTEIKKPAGPFSLAWSEYPSWSVFDVAHSKGYINGKAGELGPIETKWNVDVVLKEAEYDPCITLYGTGEVDAVAITNMDILKPSLSRKSVAILPTSTSYGADALLVSKRIKNIRQLRKHEVRGLDQSVSEYMFARNLQLKGKNPKKFKYTSMDPGAAAMAMQQKQKGIDAIAVWNPFVLQTLEKRKDVRVLFDSTAIPGEIIDMVVVADESLKKPGGADFARAVIEAFYAVNRDLADAAKADETLMAIGEKFASLPLEKMKKVVEQTRFYGTPEAGIALFTGGPVLPGVSEKKLAEVMPLVVGFSKTHGIVDKEPVIALSGNGSGPPDPNLRFDVSFMQAVKDKLN
jgi:NitT/TauT family transport system substrate-binding protein